MLLRRAEPDDALSVARVHVRAWQAAYRKLLPDAYLDGLKPEDRAQRYTFGNRDPLGPLTIVAVADGTICGFATTMAARDADTPGIGELAALHVDPAYWGRGYGVALIAAARANLVAAGFRDAILWVMAGNARAERFYRLDGWNADGTQRTDEIWGATVDELRYRRGLVSDP